MRSFYLFRSNLRILETYHRYKNLEDFKKNCWDYYLLQGIYFLEKDYFDEVVIWRLHPKQKQKDIIFTINGKKFIQRWVHNFNEISKHPKADISFFRGGFPEYDNLTKQHSKYLGIKLYLGTGRRTYPQYGGKYDWILQEDEGDFRPGHKCLPFYKTASPHIFNYKKLDIKWDICFPCNFTQILYKGQEEFIRTIQKYPSLQKLKIVHCGNKPEIGEALCKKYNVKNIQFLGWQTRERLCKRLNQSKFGLCMNNRHDGCPRVLTEILMSGTPLIISEKTRLLSVYKKNGVVEVNENNIEKKVLWALENYLELKSQVLYSINNEISFDKICKKNIESW